jgi:FkbM family methyltransferase
VGVDLLCKRAGVTTAKLLSPLMGSNSLTQWLWRRVLDERVLPRQCVLRPLWNLKVQVLCNPYTFTHRPVYWCGHLYDLALQRYLRAELRLGDSFIDVGMNLGHISSLAAKLVGERGHVYGFEVNGPLALRVQEVLQSQGLSQVQVFPLGLGEETAEAKLQMSSNEAGTNTLRDGAATNSSGCQLDVKIAVGDEIFANLVLSDRVILKVDVEGYELQVLRGMRKSLARLVQSAVIEVTPQWLGGAQGVEELFQIMRTSGFAAFELTNSGIPGRALIPSAIVEQTNVLFQREKRTVKR